MTEGSESDRGPSETSAPPSEADRSAGDTSAPAARKLRIGSQRWPTKVPPARPAPLVKPSDESPPAAAVAPGPELATPAGDAEAATDVPVAESMTPESPAPAQENEQGTSPESPIEVTPKPPVDRPAPPGAPQKGAQRKRRSMPLAEQMPQQHKVAPPSLRGELPADLQVELAEALGGMSVDEIMAGQATTPGEAEIEPDTRIEGRVLSLHRDSVFVDLGGRRQGVLSLRTLENPPEVGAVVTAVVTRFNAAEGLYELGLPGAAVDVGDWSQVSEGMLVDAHVTGHNKGGLECEVSRLRGFIPASQVSVYRVENLEQLVGEKLLCLVTEANRDKRNLVLSRRAVMEREKEAARENLLADLEVGQLRDGIVRSVRDFGAFVDLGGIDGLVHVSQLSWDRVGHPSEVVEVGQKVKVKVQKVDPATGKISLTLRELVDNPWHQAAQKYPSRSKVTGTVTRTSEFGAFVKLEPGIEGLIHISELAHKRVFRATDIVTTGQQVDVLVLSVDAEHQRISLSLKALAARPSSPAKSTEEEETEETAAPPVTKKSPVPLKGGVGSPTGGERFGLKW